MTEKAKESTESEKRVLGHHADVVRRCYPGITNINEAIRVTIERDLPLMQGARNSQGELCYPRLDKDKYIKEWPETIVAVNTSTAQIVPDIFGGIFNQLRTFDGTCTACGNGEVVDTMQTVGTIGRCHYPECSVETLEHIEQRMRNFEITKNELQSLRELIPGRE